MEKVHLNIKFSNNDLEDYKKELYGKLVNSPYFELLLSEGFTKEEIYRNISKFYDYINDLKFIKKIKTYKDCVDNDKYDRLILRKNGDLIERDFVPLEPYKKHLDYLSKFIVKDFSSELYDASFKKVRSGTKNLIKEKINSDKWVYLCGALRSGRTYAIVSLINDKYIKTCKTIAFINCPKRFKELLDLYFNDKVYFNEIFDSYANADYLVLDDFGSEYKNEVFRDSILIPLLKSRILNNKITSFTSDFTLKSIKELYSFSKSGSDIMFRQFIALLENKIDQEIITSKVSIY